MGKPGLTHRLRGHKITTYTSRLPLPHGGPAVTIEGGTVERVKHCSCGRWWTLVCTNPLQSKWRWR